MQKLLFFLSLTLLVPLAKGDSGDPPPFEWTGSQKYTYQRAQKGNPEAAFRVSGYYLKTYTQYRVPSDLEKAITWLEKSADLGYDKAIENMAAIYYNGRYTIRPDPEKSAHYLKKMAEKGRIDAQVRLGRLYLPSKQRAPLSRAGDDHKNIAEALKWFQMAAEQGDASACYYLGQMYLDSAESKPEDITTAILWFSKAADKDYEPATKKLEEIRDKSQRNDLSKNSPQIIYLDEYPGPGPSQRMKAPPPNNEVETLLYLLSLLSEEDIEQILKKAPPPQASAETRALQSNAETGSIDAQLQLAALYLHGSDSLPKDEVLAAKWYQKAAEKNNASAQYHLGRMHQYGRGLLEKNSAKAVEYYRKSAEQDNKDAQRELGLMYLNGQGDLPKDRQQAEYWLRKSFDKDETWKLDDLFK